MNYLTREVHLTVTEAANTITNYSAFASLTPLLGAFISDSFLGRFRTIAIASLFCYLGTTLFTLAAALPQLKPTCKSKTSCQSPNSGHLSMLYTPLLLLAIGSGGIRSCLAAFGADQLAQYSTNKQSVNTNTTKWNFFNWYFSVMAISVLFASTVLVYVQDNAGWVWGFGILSVATLAAAIVFVCGRPIYRVVEPCGSPYTRLMQVVVAAFRKRNLALVCDPKLLYENDDVDKYSGGEILQHSSHFKFLDKAAIVTEGDFTTPQNPNHWRLATVHRVEELKSLLQMTPIWASSIIFFMASAQEKTFSIEQANTMNRHLTKSFIIPSGSLSVFKISSMLLTIVLYDPIIAPLAKRFTNFNHNTTSFLPKMGFGFAISISATLVAGFIELKRRKTAHLNSEEPISVFWLVLQFVLHGIAEALLSIGHLEFLYDQSPESMRSTTTALFWTSSSIGNCLSTITVSIVHKSSNWIPDDLDRGKLERFYWLITVFQVVNFVYYLISVRFYTFKAVQVHCEDNDVRG